MAYPPALWQVDVGKETDPLRIAIKELREVRRDPRPGPTSGFRHVANGNSSKTSHTQCAPGTGARPRRVSNPEPLLLA